MSRFAQGNVGPRRGDADLAGHSHERALRWVGKYRILSELGRGGMSSVYLAVARGAGGVNKLVVLKAVLPELASEPGALAMFLDEARLGAQLNHPNVVQTYEVGTEGDRHVIVMEYLEGQSLAHIARRAEQKGAPLSTAMHLRIIISALEGLHYAHELSGFDGSALLLVHRDVSPQNVFVTYGGQVKVLDFGIAKASSSSTHTATGVVKGKIAYMAPEQMIADGLDRRADVYSVGCMLWAAATGRKLWKDTPDVQIMRRVINGDIPTPQSVNVAVDDELNKIVMTALATDPEQRYQTALALQEALEQYCEHFSSTVKQKEIGAFVATLFADARAELKGIVERQLATLLSDESGTDAGSDVRVFGNASPEWQTAGGSDRETSRSAYRVPDSVLTNSISDQTSLPAPGTLRTVATATRSLTDVERQPAQRKRPLLLLSGAALLLLAVSGAYGISVNRSVNRASLAKAPAAAGSAERAKTVTVQLRAEPPESELYLDEQRLTSNPTQARMDVDGRSHRLRAEAPGYSGASIEFSPLHDDAIGLQLVKVPVVLPANLPTAREHRAKFVPGTTSPAPRPARKVDCSQPFFVDSDGIKKLRRECL